ncbi:DUF3883 domain-containing protein [Desulfosporosinus hippei]|uniref:Protein NO VEIN C-terminal domain-containing protein n=1 Tax=Desulfosporosinus hippei DSM 8344 TaxID=1121419 RepID=A0A1G8CJV0_9FIRM|nr:DUF3883 domain-containing protein [Desulfosporosinus hippei]SDH45150.1 protein of unknown function [Desulfosporosinus hippei DSM 8344]
MSNVSVFSLHDYLPVYDENDKAIVRNGFLNQIAIGSSNLHSQISESMKDTIINDMNTDENSDCPEWVNNNNKLGAFGEEVVLRYLSSLGSNLIHMSKVNSSAGYDIQTNILGETLYYEVKTTRNRFLKFFISYNELKISNINRDSYKIFIVYVNDEHKKIEGYIVSNPIGAFDIDFNVLTQVYETPYVNLLANNFRVQIKETYLDNLKAIDLSKFAK